MLNNNLLKKIARWILKDELKSQRLSGFYSGIRDEKDCHSRRSISVASTVAELLGKKISAVIFKKRKVERGYGNPNMMMHLVFDDATSYEIYTTDGEVFVPISGVRCWGLDDVRDYMSDGYDTIFEAYVNEESGGVTVRSFS